MDIELTEEQRQVRDMCRDFAARELAPNARRWDEHHEFPRAAVRQLADQIDATRVACGAAPDHDAAAVRYAAAPAAQVQP